VDNFWFTLLHELGHIFLHFHRGLEAGFLDDLDSASRETAELEADSFAQSHLLADELWELSPARFAKSAELIISFAKSQSVHPAIIAGRIRKERDNYRIFDDLIGRKQIQRLFFNQMLGDT
jgi:HTH-type transcriptional regulator/antitoxin HigA